MKKKSWRQSLECFLFYKPFSWSAWWFLEPERRDNSVISTFESLVSIKSPGAFIIIAQGTFPSGKALAQDRQIEGLAFPAVGDGCWKGKLGCFNLVLKAISAGPGRISAVLCFPRPPRWSWGVLLPPLLEQGPEDKERWAHWRCCRPNLFLNRLWFQSPWWKMFVHIKEEGG